MIRTRSESRPLFKFSPDYTVFAWRHILLKKKKKVIFTLIRYLNRKKKKPLAVLACQPHFNPLDPQNAGYNSSNL